MTQGTTQLHYIVPPHMKRAIAEWAEQADEKDYAARWRLSLERDHQHREQRITTEPPPQDEQPERRPAGPAAPDRIVYDTKHSTDLPGEQVRAEGEPASQDTAVNEAYDGVGATWALYNEVYGRDSIDGNGMQLLSTVHYDTNYSNAFWNGSQMVFGDGDGKVFQGFTSAIDVTGHELTHGVTQHTANLDYEGQSGALNEHLSDVFGSMVKQRQLEQSAAEADWIIGEGIFVEGINGVGLRSMKEPGTAYDDPKLGKDPQPAHMDDYVETAEDNGGVHINSGIPNKAFYLAATEIGGNSWDGAGQIWYKTLTEGQLAKNADFATFAQATIDTAKAMHGENSTQAQAVASAWEQVGVQPGGRQAPGQDPELARAAAAGLTPPIGRTGTFTAPAASTVSANGSDGARHQPAHAGTRPDKGFGR